MLWMLRRAVRPLLLLTLLGSLLLAAGCAERLPELPPAEGLPGSGAARVAAG